MNTPHVPHLFNGSTRRAVPLLALLATAFAVSFALPARAATDTWTDNNGGGDGNWSTATNWSDPANAAPSAFDSLLFTGSNGLTNTNNFTAGTAFDGITFDSNAGAFTLNGNGVLLSGNIQAPSSAAAPGIVNTSTNNQIINLPLTLDWGTYNIGSYSSGGIAIDSTVTPGASGIILFGGTGAGATGAVSTTSLTVNSNTGLISGIEGAGLIQNSGTIGAMAQLPLATIVGGNIVALGSSSYVSVASGEFSATTNANSNVLLTGNTTNTTYFAQGLAAGENGMTYVNDIVEATGTGTIDVTGTLVFGAGASNSVGGLYLTGGTANQIMTFNASNGNAVTAGTTSAGGTLVLADNAIPGNTKNQLENNERIINNAAGGVVTVVKTGNGSMYFNNSGTGPNANSFTGGLYVDEGWLQGNATGVFGPGPIYVASGASLYVETSQANNIFVSPGLGNNGAQGFAPTNGPVGSIRFANFNALMTGSLTLQGAPVTAAPGDRMSQTQPGDTMTFANQVTGAGTLDLDTQASNTATAFAFDNTTATPNNWTGGTIIENNSSTNKLMVEDLANNQFGANNGTSAGNMTFTQSGANTSGFLEFNLNGFSDTIGALISNGGGAVDTIVNNGAGSTTSTLTIGDNGGTGTYAGLIENTGASSTLAITKTGTGTQTLTGANTFTGATTVNAGIVNYRNNTAFGTNSAITVNSGGTVQVQGGITGGSKVLTISGAGASNATGALENVSGNNSYAGTITMGANATISSDAGTLTLPAAIGDGGSGYMLTKAGAGTVSLTGVSTYSGTTNVLAGTLLLSNPGSDNSSASITINGSGAKFSTTSSVAVSAGVSLLQGAVDGTGTINSVTVADLAGNIVENGNGGTGTLTIGSLTFNGAGAVTIDDSGNSTTPGINITGDLTTGFVNSGGIVDINASNTLGWTNGVVYDLVNYAGILGSGTADIMQGTIGNLLAGQTAQITVSGTEITLVTSGGSSDVWTGRDSGNWVIGTTGANHNWKLQVGATPTDYTDGDAVVFDDSATSATTLASGTVTVSLSSTNVNPTSTTFNNSALSYTLTSGSGFGIASGSLTKSGTGTLTIQTPNTFTGPTAIEGGVANYQNGTAFGVSSAITVITGASVQLQGGITSAGTQILAVEGVGAPNATGVIENVSGANSASVPIVLNADSTISSDSGSLTLTGGITGNANLILQSESSGNGTITLSTGVINNVGTVTNNGAGSGPVTINSFIGANVTGLIQNSPTSMLVLGASNAFAGGVTITTGTVEQASPFALGSGAVSIASPGTLAINITGTFGNAVSGAGVIDWNTLGTMSATSTLGGNLSGFTGTLNLGPGGGKLEVPQTAGQQISSSATINVLNGATLFLTSATPMPANINLFGGTIGETFGQIRFSNGTSTTGTIDLEANTTLGTDHATGTISGPIVDNGMGFGFTEQGSGGIGTIILNAADTYSGVTAISGTGVNTLRLGNANAVQNSTVDPQANGQVDGVTFVSGIGTFNFGGLEGPGNIALSDTGGTAVTLNVGSNNSSNTYSGILSGNGGFTKVGNGLQTLSGASSYTGATSVTAGALSITGSLNGSSSTTVTNATLEGTGLIANGVTIGNGSNASNSAILEPGAVNTVGTLTTGTISLLSDAAFAFNLDSTGGGAGSASELIAQSVSLDAASQFAFTDIASTEGALTLGTIYTVISAPNGLTGTFGNLPNGEGFTYGINDYWATYTPTGLTLTVVPEPASWGLLISGFGMLMGIPRLRKRLMGI